MYTRSEFAVKVIIDIISFLFKNDQEDLGIMEIVEKLPYNHRTIRNYIAALQKEGVIKIEPLMNKNIVKLTNKGKYIADCLATKIKS